MQGKFVQTKVADHVGWIEINKPKANTYDHAMMLELAQAIEEMRFDEMAQPLASTLADYLLPGATEVPAVRIEHMETPSPYTEFGQKGLGESGAIGPPAAIANAVNDALRPLGVEICQTPITPRRLLAAIARATVSA